jgi:hypothetical protein
MGLNKNMVLKGGLQKFKNWDGIYFTTVCNRVYLDTAIALMESVRKYHDNCKFVIGLAENDEWVSSNPWVFNLGFDSVIFGSKLHPNYEALSTKYDITELCCAVKANLMKETLALSEKGVAIFMDPDTYAYSSLDHVLEPLEADYDIVFTPHLVKGLDVEMEMSSTRHGIFNLGFLGVANTSACISFLDWWDLRLQDYSTDNPARGYFNDQTWASLGVGFTNAFVLRNPGYNFATWTLRTSILGYSNERLAVEGNPLKFIHYSGYKSGSLHKTIIKWFVEDSQSVFCGVLAKYDEHIKKINLDLTMRGISLELDEKIPTSPAKDKVERTEIKLRIKLSISTLIFKISPKFHTFLKQFIS